MLSKIKDILIFHKRSILSVAQLFISTILGSFLVFLTQIILARTLGTSEFGMFSSILAMVTLGVPLALFGIPQLWLKVYAKEGYAGDRWLIASFQLIAISIVLVFTILYLWAFVYGENDVLSRYIIVILSSHILGQISIELVSSRLQTDGRYLYLSIWQFTPHFLRILCIIFLVIFSDDLSVLNVAYVYAAIAILTFLAGIIQLINIKKGGLSLVNNIKIAEDNVPVRIQKLLNNTWAFGLAGFFYLIYFQSDIYLIKYMLDDSMAGIYNAAFIIMIAVYMFPNVVYQKFLLPKLHRWANTDSEKFYYVYKQGNKIMFALGTLFMVCLLLFSDNIIYIIFGEEYKNATSALNILSLSVPMVFLSFSMGAILTTREYIKIKVKCMGAVAILNIILNFSLIPIYGIRGAAMATVLSNFTLLLSFYLSVKNNVFK